METVLNGLTPEACLVYLDDIIIVGKSFEEHLSNLRRVFEKLKEAKLKLNPSKCNLFRHEVNYLGHIISADGVRTDPQKVSAVKDWRRPKNVHELRSFLGLCTYYRRFVKGFSSIARPLHRLAENKQKFLWTDECKEAFNSLKAALTSSPILVYPDPEKQFILDTDASHESVGAVLSQEINGQEHVIAYWSKCLSKPERNYCVTRKELLAIIKAVENFHSYLYGRKFLLRTDHASLTWLLNFKNTEGQIARWIQKLEEYDFEIKHRKGSLHDEENTRRLVLAIIDFLQSQLVSRHDLSLEDRDGLEIAIECLEMAYGLEDNEHIQRRSLLDMFTQVSNPVSIQDKLQAESFKASGNDKMSQEQYREAEVDYSKAIELDRWNAVYFCNRAGARIKLEQLFEAISDCRQALLLNPDYAKAYGRMGQAYALMQRPRRAARCYRQALELEPDNERYRNNLNVAENQAAQQPNAEMGTLLQSIFSSILSGSPNQRGPSGGLSMPGPSFMIISEPHTQEECENNQTDVSGANSQSADSEDQERSLRQSRANDSNQSSEEDEEESIHLRVLFGIPVMTQDDSSASESQQSRSPDFINRGFQNQTSTDSPEVDDRKHAYQRLKGQGSTNKEDKGIQNVPKRKTDIESSTEQDNAKNETVNDNATTSTQGMRDIDERFNDSTSNKPRDEPKRDNDIQPKIHESPVNSSKTEQTNTCQSNLSSEQSDENSERRSSSIINMSDISNFFRNFARSDNQAKDNPTKENSDTNSQNKAKPDDKATSASEKQTGKSTFPEVNKNNEEAKEENDSPVSDTKQEEKSGTQSILKKDDDQTKNK
ncbi:retrovirus-related Pol polyprotein from transposon 17.6 [Trichonephila clavata]|uniref:RNA-directed DNA polymerase n=1 Tax=Trichonephila clavata TaxID=2740835 RepID=A0A8X6HPL2_TRICU|nr:retrovirus-related Pol polyprotein from transposon 17.6 [Trichonephila clavata]